MKKLKECYNEANINNTGDCCFECRGRLAKLKDFRLPPCFESNNNTEKCKKCGEDFIIPKNTIDMTFALYCMDCITKAVKEKSKMSISEYMKLTAKGIGL